MYPRVRTVTGNVLARIGSLWFAAVLLVLLLMALACATVYESAHGSSEALTTFYRSPWFTTLLILLGFNITAAVVVRWPLPIRKYPFAITHTSIVLILVGAALTKLFGVEGQVALQEGQTTSVMHIREPAIIAKDLASGETATLALPDSVAASAVPLEPNGVASASETIQLSLLRYLPDSTLATEFVNDATERRTAVEVRISSADGEHTGWVSEGEQAKFGALAVGLTVVEDENALRQRLAMPAGEESDSVGRVHVKFEGTPYEWPLEDCRDQPVPLGDTGVSLRVLEYWPHANVGSGGTIRSMSHRPENPAIRVEITGPFEPQRRLVFARFPGFKHGTETDGPDIELTFESSGANVAPPTPIEVLAAPGVPAQVRFSLAGGDVRVESVSERVSVETPFPGVRFELLRRFDRARRRQVLKPVLPVGEEPETGVLVALQSAGTTEEIWLQHHHPVRVTLSGKPMELVLGDNRKPLGCDITLDQFTVGYYPGTQRPRSFESRITIQDPQTGRSTSHVVSMNHPTKHNGFHYFQSSYELTGNTATSVLSVTRDPGMPVVFLGYISLLIGMVSVLATRARERRQLDSASAGAGRSAKGGGVHISLPRLVDVCAGGPVPVGAGERDQLRRNRELQNSTTDSKTEVTPR